MPKSRDQISLALGESQAFQKMDQGFKHVIEACTELNVLRQDNNWAQIALAMEKVSKTAAELFNKSTLRALKFRM